MLHLLWLIAAATALLAQADVYPPVLYSGNNALTITCPDGIRQIMGFIGGRWTLMHTGLSAPYVKVTSAPMFGDCATRVKMSIFIMKANPAELFRLRIVTCDGDIQYFDFNASERWDVFHEQFGTVQLGATACHTFRVDTRGTTIVIDSVASPSPLFKIRYFNGHPPLRVTSGSSYLYDVCFRPARIGFVKMPILVYLRRRYPAGGFTNFIVADTAYVNVVQPNTPLARVDAPPAPQRPRQLTALPPLIIHRPKPRPKPVPPPAAPHVDTPHVAGPPPQITSVGYRTIPMAVDPPAPAPGTAPPAVPVVEDEVLTDPTTHRVVLMPTARSVNAGRFFVANYELGGWLAGYGAGDRLTLLAGGAYVPPAISYNLVATAGARYELLREGTLRGALGVQGSLSRTDISSITLAAPYAVASIGDDDQRASIVLGYTWRHHTPRDGTPAFDRNAALLAAGGDYRFAEHWKVAAEAYLLESADYQPLVATVRYFGRNFAVDAGLGINMGLNGAGSGTLRAAPVVTATWVW
ncbi:MAG: hypothetical protein JST22_07165 [Bacteroidetes bacterium]|nr:hypothetical protein [Bacteroidota bacterium]